MNRVMGITPECEITDEGITVRVLGFPKRIPFSEIKKIEKVSYARAALESMNPLKPAMWGLWNMSRFGVVLIETADRRRWAISPKNRDEFVNLVSKHLTVSNQGIYTPNHPRLRTSQTMRILSRDAFRTS